MPCRGHTAIFLCLSVVLCAELCSLTLTSSMSSLCHIVAPTLSAWLPYVQALPCALYQECLLRLLHTLHCRSYRILSCWFAYLSYIIIVLYAQCSHNTLLLCGQGHVRCSLLGHLQDRGTAAQACMPPDLAAQLAIAVEEKAAALKQLHEKESQLVIKDLAYCALQDANSRLEGQVGFIVIV